MKKKYSYCPYYTIAGKEEGKPGGCGFTRLFKEEVIEDTSIICSLSWEIMRRNFSILLECKRSFLFVSHEHICRLLHLWSASSSWLLWLVLAGRAFIAPVLSRVILLQSSTVVYACGFYYRLAIRHFTADCKVRIDSQCSLYFFLFSFLFLFYFLCFNMCLTNPRVGRVIKSGPLRPHDC